MILPAMIFAVALEGGDDVQLVMLGRAAGANRAAVDHDGWAIQPGHGHDAAGHVLVAAGQGDEAVVPLGGHHRLDGVGDDFAGLQRVAHAVGAHADAVADADGVEAHAHQIGRFDAFFHFGGQVEQVHVAGVALVPDAGNAHLGLVHVGSAHAGAVEHRLRGALRLWAG